MGLAAIASALTLGAHLIASNPLTLRVAPTVGSEPADLFVQAFVEAHEDNRSLEIQLESDALLRRSTIQLDGVRAPRLSQFHFRGLPAGTYHVMASLGGSMGTRARATRTIVVISTGR